MLIGIQGIASSWRLQSFTDEARDALGTTFIEELKTFYEAFDTCCSLVELGVDFPDHEDIQGFLDYVDSMSDRDFTFYALGRWSPKDSLPERISQSGIRAILEASPDREAIEKQFPRIHWADEVPKFKKNVVDLWSSYWK